MENCHIEQTRSCDMEPRLPPCPGCGADEPENCDCGGYYAGLDQDEPNDYERHDLPVPPPLVGASAPAVFSEGEHA